MSSEARGCEGVKDEVIALPLQGLHAVRSGKTSALISAHHAGDAFRHVWVLAKDGYAITTDARGYKTRLHHFIWSRLIDSRPPFLTADGQAGVIDHINRDRLDNRDCNLRCITTQQNNWNRTYGDDTCLTQAKDGTWSIKLVRGGETLRMSGIATKEEARVLRDAHQF